MRWIRYSARRANTALAGSVVIDDRLTRHYGYAKLINFRRGIKKVFGCSKLWSGFRQSNLRITCNVSVAFDLLVIAHNLICLGILV